MGILYFRDGQLIAEHGDARVYVMDGLRYLEVGKNGAHSLWTHEGEIQWYFDNDLVSRSKGNCLEFGLGLGFASEIILSNSKVKKLITVEIDLDVVAIQDEVNPISDERHIIVNDSLEEYLETTKNTFDFIFIDTYITTDDETLLWLEDMVPKAKSILNPGGDIMAWLDEASLEEEKKRFNEILNF